MNELFKPPNNPRIGLLLSGFYKWGNRQGDWRACNGARIWWGVQYSCLENAMDGGAWWAAVHGVWKSQTQLSHFTFTFHFHALVKEMTTHSSILAWRIPGMVEPHGLPSVGSQSRTLLKRLSSSSLTQKSVHFTPWLGELCSSCIEAFSAAWFKVML